MPLLNEEIISFCRNNFKRRNITLYLGAGVSIDNNIPSWDKLILAMYFSTISEQQMQGWWFHNYCLKYNPYLLSEMKRNYQFYKEPD